MRTILTIDDDIAAALRDRARALNRPFEQLVNETLRRGISLAARKDLSPYRIIPNQSGFRPGIDPLRLSQLSDELETEALLPPAAECSSRIS